MSDMNTDLTVGEAVDDAVSKLREIGIVIEGGQAHLAHAILRSAMTKAIEQVRAGRWAELESGGGSSELTTPNRNSA